MPHTLSSRRSSAADRQSVKRDYRMRGIRCQRRTDIPRRTNSCIVIHEGIRKHTKECVHISHLGVESLLRRAENIRQVVENCEACRSYERSQKKETLIQHETPTLQCQWEKVGVDLFSWEGRDFQVIVDYTNNFWDVDRLNSKTITSVIKQLKPHFARFGMYHL